MRKLILLLLCSMWIDGYAQSPNLKFPSYREKYVYLKSLSDYVHDKPAKQALDTIAKVETAAIGTGDRELVDEVKLISRITAFYASKTPGDAIENAIKDVAVNAAKNNSRYLLADALKCLGDYYIENKHQQSAAIESYIEAYNVYKNFTATEFPPKHDYLYALGGACYKFADYDNALKYLRESKRAKDSVARGDECSLYNTMGLCYRNMKQYDSAIFYFKLTYQIAVNERNIPYQGIAEGNIGITYFHEGKYNEAIPLLKKDIESSLATTQLKNAAVSMTTLATIYNDQHDYSNAEQLLQHSLSLCRSKSFWNNYAIAEPIYKQLYKTYEAKNNYRLACLYADSAMMANDSSASVNNRQALAKAHDNIEYTQHKLESENMQNQLKSAQNEVIANRKINLALGLSTILFLALLIMVYVKNKQIAAEKENSDRQKLRAENSEKFKQQFLANMSHEIRTPMNAVIGMTSLMLEKNPRPDQLGFLQAISKSSDILLHTINDILDLSKIEAGKMELEAIDFSFSDTMKQVINTLTYRAEEKGLQIVSNIDHNVPDIVVGDPYRLNQVLVNLGGNAIKFTERGGVELAIKKIRGEHGKITVQVAISDTGIGIPPDKLKNLFSDFTQVSSSDTRKYGGTGLGLSISKQLVEMQGGKISVDSSPGVGTTFSFEITYPIGSYEKLQERIASESKNDGSILNGLRILIADDNEYNRMVVNETLHLKADVYTDVVTTGEEAIKMLEQHDYDVILMDVQMPVMNGTDATRHIRSKMSSPKKDIPIIAFTASILRSDIEMFMASGMNSYLPKPFKVWQLIRAIADVAGRKSAPAKPAEKVKAGVESTQVLKGEPGAVTDMSYLVRFCEGNEARMKKYMQMYINAIPAFKENLIQLVEAKDFATIKIQMHTFKSNWIFMGMKTAASLGATIEHQCLSHSDAAFDNIQLLIEQTDFSVNELSAHPLLQN